MSAARQVREVAAQARRWSAGRILHLLFEIIARTTTSVIAIGLIAWLLGRIASDRHEWSQWLLWIPTACALPAAIAGLVLALRPRLRAATRASRGRGRRRVLAWAATTLILGIHFLFIEHRFFHAAPEASGLTVTHWTAAYSGPRRIEANLQTLLELAGDVTIFSHDIQFARRPEARHWLGESGRVIHLWPFTVMTRLPVIQARPLVSNDEIWAAMIELDASESLGGTIVICMVDLPSEPHHARAEIARRLRAGLDQAQAPAPHLVVGDFNMTRGSASVRSIFPDLVHAFDQAGHGYGASFHRELPLYHIDQMLIGPELRATRYDLVDPGFGRHLAQRGWIVRAEANQR